MICVTTTKAREDAYTAMKQRADALGITESFYASAPPLWWQRIAEQANQAGAVLVLNRDVDAPVMVVMTLAQAEELVGISSS